MDALLEQARSIWEGQIDFEGQRLAELISTLLLSTFGLLAFLVGFITHNITYTLWIGLGGTALTFVIVVPPWPFFNQNPVHWLPARSGGRATGYDITVDGRKVQ